MSNRLGNKISVTVFGQSHAPAIGAVIEGLPAGLQIDMERVNAFMKRRAPGGSNLSTARKEADLPEIISGLNERGETCGAPLTCVIHNGDHRSHDYDKLRELPRPGHADYTAFVKFGGHNDIRGGGQFSGRLTAPLCFAGAVCMQLLEKMGVKVGAHVYAIAGVEDEKAPLTPESLADAAKREIPVLNIEAGEAMRAAIEQARAECDSVGGIVEAAAFGVPAGLGDPMFDGVENRLAQAIFGIPAVRGVEFGTGFAAAAMRGSAHNDPFEMADGGVQTASNHHGGALGGITSGMPIVLRAAFKPTPSIAKEQATVSLVKNENSPLVITGRHDPCVVIRAVPVVEAVMAIVLCDMICEGGNKSWI